MIRTFSRAQLNIASIGDHTRHVAVCGGPPLMAAADARTHTCAMLAVPANCRIAPTPTPPCRAYAFAPLGSAGMLHSTWVHLTLTVLTGWLADNARRPVRCRIVCAVSFIARTGELRVGWLITRTSRLWFSKLLVLRILVVSWLLRRCGWGWRRRAHWLLSRPWPAARDLSLTCIHRCR